MSETARELVDRLAAAGEWPEPRLLEEILARGEEAVEPLREVVRREAHGWPDEAPLDFAIHLLGSLGAVSAVPDLVELFRRYEGETAESTVAALGYLGPDVIEPALAVARDESVRWHGRSAALSAAQLAAGDDPQLLARVAATARGLLAQQLDRARKEQAEAEGAEAEVPAEAEGETAEREEPEAELPADEDFEEDDWDEDEPDEGGGREADVYHRTTSLVLDLVALADPQARPLLDAAYDLGLVDEWMINREDVERSYREGRRPRRQEDPRAWLARYRGDHVRHVTAERQAARDAARAAPRLHLPEPPPAPDLARVDPFRRTGRKIGRNEPCWCGSGKKYKHCHLRQDQEGIS